MDPVDRKAQGAAADRVVVGGDSAGGHLALMLVAKLQALHLPQPSLTIALSPWTDIGRRGESQFGNDRYDMVQGYQTLLYGHWLKATTAYGDAELSPIHQSYRNVAPIYLQAGGKEILALQRASRFIPTKADNYNGIKDDAEQAGLLK